MRRLALIAALLLASGPAFAQSSTGAGPKIDPLPQKATIRVSMSLSNIYPITILYGMDKGWFAKANLDLQVQKFTQAAATLAPMLARGDIDIAPQTESPSFFNLLNQGFGVKAVTTFVTQKQGREEDTWILLAKEHVGKVKEFKELKGGTIEAGPVGSGAHFLVLSAMKNAGLVAGKDVTITNKSRSAGDFLALAKAGGQDAEGMIEPQASQAEAEGYGQRWLALSEVAPGAQTVVMATSEDFLQKNGPALRKFLEVYALSAREMNKSNGEWTPDLMRIITGWTGLTPELIRRMGGVPYVDPNPEVSAEAMARSQQLWLDNKVLTQKTDVNALIDRQPMTDALNAIGRQ